jgi:Protein of unknown function (DUF1656)
LSGSRAFARLGTAVEQSPKMLALTLNHPELRLFGLLVPWIFVTGLLGFFIAWLIVYMMEHTGLSRRVWHLPLFFLALMVLITSLIGLFFSP